MGAGLEKATNPKDMLKEKGMAWTDDFSATQVKGIGALEVFGLPGDIAFEATHDFLLLRPSWVQRRT